MRSEAETDRALSLYADMVRRICLYRLQDRAETEDVFQDVFLKYLLYDGAFQDEEHEKAWFIRVTLNACKDHLRSLLRRPTVPLETLEEEAGPLEPERREVLEAVLSLPPKYRDVIYLHYYEGYSAAEIAVLLKTRENTVYSHLSRGRDMLRVKLGGDPDGE